MRKVAGVSLTELVTSIAIVSVLGAGVFVGVTQLEDARQQVESRAIQMANAELLLPLIEMEQARHGQQVLNAQPACLLDQSGSEWLNTCKGDAISTPASGFMTCRIDENGQAIRTVIYHASAANKPGKQPDILYRLFRETFETEDCDLTDGVTPATPGFYAAGKNLSEEANLTSIESRFVLSEELASLEVSFGADGETLSTNAQFVSNQSLQTVGDTSEVVDNTLDFESQVAPSLLQDQRPTLSFITSRLTLASGADATVYVVADEPLTSELTAQLAIGESTKTIDMDAGDSRGSVVITHASTADPLILKADDAYLIGQISELRFDVEEEFIPSVRLAMANPQIAYGGPSEPIEVFLTGSASGATAIGLELDNATSCSKSAGVITLTYQAGSSCEYEVTVDDGEFSVSENLSLQAGASGTAGNVIASIQAASGNAIYNRKGTQSITIGIGDTLPTLSFLASASDAVESASDSKRHRITLLSDKALSRSITVNLQLTGTAVCGTDYDVVGSDECSDIEITFPAGAYEHALEIDVSSDSVTESDETIVATLQSGRYEIDDSADTHTATIKQYSTVSFTNLSITTITESSGSVSIPLNISPAAQTDLKLYFASAAADATSNEFVDWTLANTSDPLVVSKGASSANLTISVTNDDVPEGVEKIALTFDEDRFIGEVIAASGSQSVLAVTDESGDKCYPAGDLTIGSTTTQHFHHNTDGTNEVINALIKGGSVQITSGFDSDNDRLTIKGETATNSTNLRTYSDVSFATGGKSYVFDIDYTLTSGVMKILIDEDESTDDEITAAHLVEFFNDYVQLIVEDFSDTTTRDVVFTLGDAQAWDKHEDKTVHYYRFVEDLGGTETGGNDTNNDGINFPPAFNAAKNTLYFGVPGYLATVTSKAENDFLAEKFKINGEPTAGWLGGANRTAAPPGIAASDWPANILGPNDRNKESDLETGFKFGWVNGPEKGQLFWSGLGGCGDPIAASSNTQVDIFPYKSASDGDTYTQDEDDVRAGKQSDGFCNYNFGSTWPAVTDQDIAALRCIEQTPTFNGQAHGKDSPYQMTYGYNYSSELDNEGRVNPDANTYRFSNFGCGKAQHTFNEPNYWKHKEYFVQLTGLGAGGRTWNDLPEDPNLQTNEGSLIYNVKGYYVEWGGKNAPFAFTGKKLSQTNTVTPYKCQVAH